MQPALVYAPDSTGKARTRTVDEFRRWLRGIPKATGLAVDTETAGLGWSDAVRLVQFGTSDEGYAVRVDCAEGRALALEAFTLYAGILVFHNAPFDLHALERIGADWRELWPRVVDTYVLSHVYDPASEHGLDALNARWLGADNAGYKKAFRERMRKNGWTWGTVPLLALVPYGVSDTIATHQLYRVFFDLLSYNEWDVVTTELEVEQAVWGIERRGMRLDREYAVALDDRWGREIEALKAQMASYPLAPRPCARCKGSGKTPKGTRDCSLCAGTGTESAAFLTNPNADAQIARALELEGWVPRVFTDKSNKPKLDQDVLETMAGEYELVDLLLEYKRLNKWREAYVRNCLEQVDEYDRVHAKYNSLGARTGRMSCSNPPLQQLPKGGGGEVRRLFVASPGNVVASVDYSAVEFRLAGALSGEPRIIDVYKGGGDWYQQVADDLGITRPEAKVFVLAITYGARGRRIARALNIKPAKGTRLVKEFWSRYPVLDAWLRKLEEQAEKGLMPESWWGRRLMPHAPYAAGNARIQGTAAEVMKAGLLRLRDAGLLDYVVGIVHDEVVLDVPESWADTITAKVAEVLSDDTTFACPLVAEGKVYGRSWGDGYAA